VYKLDDTTYRRGHRGNRVARTSGRPLVSLHGCDWCSFDSSRLAVLCPHQPPPSALPAPLLPQAIAAPRSSTIDKDVGAATRGLAYEMQLAFTLQVAHMCSCSVCSCSALLLAYTGPCRLTTTPRYATSGTMHRRIGTQTAGALDA
jgi:hypothetical protein